MLALIADNEILDRLAENSIYTLPDGRVVMGAVGGYESPEVEAVEADPQSVPVPAGWYRMETIQPAEPLPEGKVALSTHVEIVDGHPQYVHVLVDDIAQTSEIISRRQFYEGLAEPPYEIISKPEALAAMKTGMVPAAIQAVIDGMTDPDARFQAEMRLIGAGEFHRSSPLVLVFLIALGWSEAQADAFWRFCATL